MRAQGLLKALFSNAVPSKKKLATETRQTKFGSAARIAFRMREERISEVPGSTFYTRLGAGLGGLRDDLEESE